MPKNYVCEHCGITSFGVPHKWCLTCRTVPREKYEQLEATLRQREQELAETQKTYTVQEPCGHFQNFMMGDHYGHFHCQVCSAESAERRLAELETELERRKQQFVTMTELKLARDKRLAEVEAGLRQLNKVVRQLSIDDAAQRRQLPYSMDIPRIWADVNDALVGAERLLTSPAPAL